MLRRKCGTLRANNQSEKVNLSGWVSSRRDFGSLIFIALRDRSGIVQLTIDEENNPKVFKKADQLRLEFVISIHGTVELRDEKNKNPKMPTGEVEIHVDKLEIINTCEPLPFPIIGDETASEEVRLKYRFLDLRRPIMQDMLRIRYESIREIRNFLDKKSFWEIETPILTRSTPEGARDYLVPSRKYLGNFFALPQSPQQFKQMLQTAGVERYFQIAKCFRDEDLRGDRQPEFTQLDLECSFIDQDEIIELTEELFAHVMKVVKDVDVELPLPKMTYDEAMLRYGKDAPDTRFGLELRDVTEIAREIDFPVFTKAVEAQGVVRGICVPNASKMMSRKKITELEKELIAQFPRVNGLLWTKVDEANQLVGGIGKFFNEEDTAKVLKIFDANPNDVLLFIADTKDIVCEGLGTLRLWLGKKLELIDENKFNFLWVEDFPMFEFSEEDQRWYAKHHPFTKPNIKTYKALKNPGEVKAHAYDLVLNGVEVAGGSIRSHDPKMLIKIFETLGMKTDEIEEQFGHLLRALSFGTPPHGGIAAGLDRFIMLICGFETIRDVIPFPKTLQSKCLMTEAPAKVDSKQLEELGLEIKLPETENQS